MTVWILVVALFSADGLTTTTHSFNTEDACRMAGTVITMAHDIHPRHVTMVIDCIEDKADG